ncbi:flagellin [Cellvibrio sp.]|uniref:flagellin N-terminal helical domain-containing protein n=1 Tax=Cellvibrio sp. TaxID=1965322 RepID=UPI0039647B79
MSLVINTNVASLNSQRQLMNSGGALDKATERLSSGQRINSAKDDAAGLAISNRMTSQVRGLDQAIRNANDGISLIQTAEGALQETTNILQRMRELSIQAGNGIYSDADRKTLDAEVQQLTAELNRIATSTSFNGQKLLDGTLGKVNLQVGADAGQTITMKIPKMDAKTLGMGTTGGDVTGTHLGQAITSTSFKDGDILINGQSIGAFDGTKIPPDTFEKLLANINEKVEGITATAFNEVTTTTVGTGVTTSANPINVQLTNPDGTTSQFTINNTNNMNELIDAINVQSGGLIVATKTEAGLVTLANANGATMTISGGGAAAGLGAITSPSYGQIALTSKNGQDIVITQGPNAQQPTTVTSSDFPAGTITAGGAGNLVINGVTVALVAADTPAASATKINAVSATTGVVATVTAGVNGGLKLVDTKGRDITISGTAATLTATGLSAATTKAPSLLAALGFQETRSNASIFGQHITAPESTTPLAYGDLKINGETISGENTSTLQGKVDNINKVSDTTGVIASLKAENVSNFNGNKLSTEVTAGAFVAATAGNIIINGVNVATLATDSLSGVITKINAQFASTGVIAFQDNAVPAKLHLYSDGQININETAGAAVGVGLTVGNNSPAVGATGSVVLNNTQISLSDITSLTTVISEINAQQASTGVFASLNDLGQLILNSNSAFSINVGDVNGGKTLANLGLDTTLAGPMGGLRATNVLASISLNSLNDTPISLEVTANGKLATGLQSQNQASAGVGFGSSLNSISIATQAGAQKAIGIIDKALDTINDVRSQMGAINNRLEFTINNLANVSEKTSASRSRITDADFAAETAAMSRAQVLQQAATAMLAQSNARPQQVLSLLKG